VQASPFFFFIGGAKQKKSKPKGNSREFHQKERISKKKEQTWEGRAELAFKISMNNLFKKIRSKDIFRKKCKKKRNPKKS
jgi:hypothetical protein